MRLQGLLSIIIFTMLGIGCSSSSSPTIPGQSNEEPGIISGDAHSIHNMLGMFTFICDPATETVDVIPMRAADLHLNALKLLEPPALILLTIEGPVKITGNILDVNIGLRSPFPGWLQYTGFDVCGIVFTHGNETAFDDPSLIIAGEGDTRLLNADGFTRWWNPTEFPHGDTLFNYIDGLLGTPASQADFNCTLNGYKYYADDLEKDDPLTMLYPAHRGLFTAGKQNIRHYTIDMAGGLVFNYAVDACWKKPDGEPPYDVPDDFPPAANRDEAYYVEMTILQNSLYHVDQTYLQGGELRVSIDVWDRYGASLNHVYAYSPSGIPLAEALTPTGGGENYSTYELDFTNENPTHNGIAEMYIEVRSEASGYGGALPGIPLSAYFKLPFNISPDAPPGWALTWGGSDQENAWDVALDGTGNIYVCGDYRDATDFDPGPGVCERACLGNASGFISKFNPNAVFQWVLTFEGDGSSRLLNIEIDSLGNLIVCGDYKGVTDFDPGLDVDLHSSNGSQDAFVCKLTNEGSFQWALTWGGAQSDEAYCLSIDSLDNIYVSGWFGDEIDLDPGPGVDLQGTAGEYGSFLSKFKNNGDYILAHTWQGKPEVDEDGMVIFSVAVDEVDDVYLTGEFEGTIDFDPGPGTLEYTAIEPDEYDAFAVKLDNSGALIWAYAWGSQAAGRDIAFDGLSSVYFIGEFHQTIDFDPGPGVDEQTPQSDIYNGFVCRYLPSGTYDGAFAAWALFGGFIEVYSDHDVYINDWGRAFMRYSPEGELQWWHTLKADANPQANGLGSCLAPDDSTFSVGWFDGDDVDFKPGDGVDYHSSSGPYDAYLLKLTPGGTWW